MQDVRAEGVMMRGWASMCPYEWESMCPYEWASMCLCEWACVCASGHVSVRVGMCLCEWACVCASGHVSVRVRWECVTIMKGWESVWGDKTYLCGEMQVGTDAIRVRGNASMWVGQGGIHVRTCRWAWM